MGRAWWTDSRSGISRRRPRGSEIADGDLCGDLKLEIENWRWAGVPFYLRAGKRLAKRVTEITIQFKQPPMLLFDAPVHGRAARSSRTSSRCGSSRTRASRCALARRCRGRQMTVCPVMMDFSYAQAFGAIFGERLRAAAAGRNAWAMRRCLRIATAWRRRGRCTRRCWRRGRRNFRETSPTTRPARGGRRRRRADWARWDTWQGVPESLKP